MNDIKENLKEINERIKNAAVVSGRKMDDILLLGVTKTVDVDRIKSLMEYGVKSLGENRVQELLSKYEVIGRQAKWHLIGSLQTNKVKYIIDKVELIHSVESVKLAEEIDKQSKKYNKVSDILVEVNIAGESSKHGIEPDNVSKFIDEISRFDNISVRGVFNS